MKLSTKCRYGLRAMLELARHYNDGPVNRKTITEAQNISKAYLENILTTLREQNLIRTTRGANGGFVLQVAPEKITVFQIVNALEGSIAPVDCVETESACENAGPCAARQVWKKLYDAQVATLSAITLADVLDMDIASHGANYVI